MPTVFRFKIYYDGDEEMGVEPQVRYVLADTEDEAERKLEEHNLIMHRAGFAPFHIIYGATVETENVIV